MSRIAIAAAVMLGTATLCAAPAQAAPGHKPVHCTFTPTPENPAARPVDPPRAKAKSHGDVRILMFTNHGAVVMVMNRDNAPCAVHNFAHLARNDFYDDSQCWRLTNSARLGVLQCGDIYRAEEGGPGYKFDDEVTGKETYPRGTVAMGNQGPGTNGSEFFIVHSHANIKPNYTVLGRVTHGMDTLDRIVAAGISPPGSQDGAPAKPVRIYKIVSLPGR
ncbi:peptidylprolyl isomerase [Herbihabitans rhizosphaerae]|nr:peptidylprolyl isomerase [Herbihabitans rhizosphaerae]